MAQPRGLKPIRLATEEGTPVAGVPITADQAVAIAQRVAPTMPPAQMAPAIDNRPATMAFRVREHTLASLARKAREEGTTQKLLLMRAMAAFGIEVAPDDLTERPPPNRR